MYECNWYSKINKKRSFSHQKQFKKKKKNCPENSWLFLKLSKEAFCIGFERPKNNRTAWRLPDGPRADKKNNILSYIIAFCRNPNLKIFRGKKVDTQTKEANAKKWNQSQKNYGLKKGLFFGAPWNSGSWNQNVWNFVQKIKFLQNILYIHFISSYKIPEDSQSYSSFILNMFSVCVLIFLCTLQVSYSSLYNQFMAHQIFEYN